MIIRALTVTSLVAAFVAVPSAQAAPHPFRDSFDGAVHGGLTYGLNDNLKQRQGSGAVTYSRLSGLPDDATVPTPQHAQVNNPKYRGKLSMHLGTTAVRLDAPSAGSVLSATLTPVAGNKTSGDWSSIVLSESANSSGHVTSQDTNLSFLVRANGGVQVLQPGQPAQTFEHFARPNYDGSFRVTLTLSGSSLELKVNGARRTVALGAAVPTERLWVYLGRHAGNDRTVSLVDDLTMSAMESSALRKLDPRLRFFGYDVTASSQLPALKGRSNLNRVDADLLKGCAPASCVVETSDANTPERWQRLAAKVRPHLGRVAAFSVHGATPEAVAASARLVKQTFPDKKVLLIEAGAKIDDAFTVPAEVDWVGFVEYCADYTRLDTLMTKLEERAPGKELFLALEGGPTSTCPDQSDESVERTMYMYLEMARLYTSYVGLLVTGPWPQAGPRATDAQERSAAVVLGDAR